ncbi:MAG: DUF5053 domain-containing protein [Mediterranea sp.]|jgi:hypothetical protein|nr:DUF5053 domain-containing protein [Mediterranea sp.]
MKEEIDRLNTLLTEAKTSAERNAATAELDALIKKDMGAFAQGLLDCIEDSNRKHLNELPLKKKMELILPFLSVSTLTRTYFQKSPQWFYHKLYGHIVNGNPESFNQAELKILAEALKDISNKIGSINVL